MCSLYLVLTSWRDGPDTGKSPKGMVLLAEGHSLRGRGNSQKSRAKQGMSSFSDGGSNRKKEEDCPLDRERGIVYHCDGRRFLMKAKGRRVKNSQVGSVGYLTTEEILEKAMKRAKILRRKSRTRLVKEHRELMEQIRQEAIAKGVAVGDFLDGD